MQKSSVLPTVRTATLKGNGYLVSWCVGHLVELAPPNVYDAKYVKWSIADLPILPERWQYLVSASHQKAVWHPAKTYAPPGCGQHVICAYGRRARGRTDFPLGVPASRLQKALFSPVAVQHGGNRHPGGFCRTSNRQLNTMPCIRLHSAGNVPTGWSASMRPGFFRACTVNRWRWGVL